MRAQWPVQPYTHEPQEVNKSTYKFSTHLLCEHLTHAFLISAGEPNNPSCFGLHEGQGQD